MKLVVFSVVPYTISEFFKKASKQKRPLDKVMLINYIIALFSIYFCFDGYCLFMASDPLMIHFGQCLLKIISIL